MTKTWPDAVDDLIEALEWRAERMGQMPSTTVLSETSEELPQLLLFCGPAVDTWNSQDTFVGHESMIDFLANSSPGCESMPRQVMCLVTIGDSFRPHMVSFGLDGYNFDVLVTATTLLAYYEAKEKLPNGFTKEVITWLMQETHRIGYSSEEQERYCDQIGQRAVMLFREAIFSVSDVRETPILMKIFGEERFAYSSRRLGVVGRATRLFARTFCQPGQDSYNEVLADIFEYKAREVLTRFFVGQIAYKYDIDPDTMTYKNLPRSKMVGALAHLPVQKELPDLDPALEG